jgi:hypothetical protein
MIGTVDNPDLAGKVIQGIWYESERLKGVGMDILAKHCFKCSACGFVSRPSKQVPHGYMVPVDSGHPGLAALTLKTATCLCPLCASAIAVNWAVADRHSDRAEIVPAAGSLIWLPEVTQAKICLVATYTLVGVNALDSTHDLASVLNDADTAFRGRSAHLASNIPLYKNDRDSDFARALALLPEEYYEYRTEVLEGVRFWPSSSFWVKQAEYWNAATYQSLE